MLWYNASPGSLSCCTALCSSRTVATSRNPARHVRRLLHRDAIRVPKTSRAIPDRSRARLRGFAQAGKRSSTSQSVSCGFTFGDSSGPRFGTSFELVGKCSCPFFCTLQWATRYVRKQKGDAYVEVKDFVDVAVHDSNRSCGWLIRIFLGGGATCLG